MTLIVFQVLVALRSGEQTAAEIRTTIRELDGGDANLPLSSFYRALNEGVDAGWIEIGASPPSGRGRPSQRYRLAASGVARVEREAERLAALARCGLGHAIRESES